MSILEDGEEDDDDDDDDERWRKDPSASAKLLLQARRLCIASQAVLLLLLDQRIEVGCMKIREDLRFVGALPLSALCSRSRNTKKMQRQNPARFLLLSWNIPLPRHEMQI